jgi:uncharacterized LabA/DUF88 family protein
MSAVLIDGGYYEKLRLKFNKPDIDLVAFSDEICRPMERFRTYYFDAMPWTGDPATSQDSERKARKQRYLDGIKMLKRFDVRLGRVQKKEIPCGNGPPHTEYIQKLVDVLFSVEMVRLAWSGHVRLIVLVAGDSDFVPAVQAAKDAGVLVRLVHGHSAGLRVHNEMLMASDERMDIDRDLVDRCLRNRPPA